MASCKMFRFMTAFDWCSGGYDLFDWLTEWSLLSQGNYPEALDSNMADTHVRACACLSATKARVTHPGIAAEVTAGPNYMESHTNISGGGVRIWKSIILPSVKEDT